MTDILRYTLFSIFGGALKKNRPTSYKALHNPLHNHALAEKMRFVENLLNKTIILIKI